MSEPVISQTSRPRCVVEGTRTSGEHRGRCTIIAIRQPDGSYLVYPHGAEQLEVRLGADAAHTIGDFLTGRAA